MSLKIPNTKTLNNIPYRVPGFVLIGAVLSIVFFLPRFAGAVETPTNVFFDEVTTNSITVSIYAPNPAFSSLETGSSGVNVSINGTYTLPWRNGNKWTTKAVLPTGRSDLAGAAIGGKVYAIGGVSGSFLTTNEAYDPVTATWGTKAPMMMVRGTFPGVVAGGKIYAIGGYNSTGQQNQNEEYDPVADTWTIKPVMPTARAAQGIAAVGGKIYVVGGDTGTTWTNANEEYNPVTNTWTTGIAVMPTARKYLVAESYGGKIYAIGGMNAGNLTTNEAYDPVANTWTPKAAIPMAPGRQPAAAVIGGKIYVTGGSNTLTYNQVYDLLADTWTIKAAIPTGRYQHATPVVKGKLYSIGGIGGTAINEEYDPGVVFTFPTLTPNTQYSFKAKARQSDGVTYTAETAAVSTYTLAALPGVATPAFTDVSSNAVTVNWTQNTNPTGTTLYRTQMSFDPAFGVGFVTNSYNLSASFRGLVVNTTYYFRVAAVNGNGVMTAYTTLGSTMTLVEAPTSIYFDEVSSTSITASGYAATPAFTGLETGLSGVALAINNAYKPWRNGNKWTPKTGMPTARWFFAAGAIGGKLYAVGGDNGGGTYYNKNEEYDPVANTWAAKAVMPTVRSYLSAGVIGGKLYAVGGYYNDAQGDHFVDNNEEYDPASNTWMTKTPMPTARRELSAGGVIGGKLYALGGYNGTSQVNINEEYDPAANTWATKTVMPTARGSLSVGVIGGKLYAAGGGNAVGVLNTNEEYDPITTTWTTKAVMPTPRDSLSAGVIGGKLYTVGGWDGSSYSNVHEEYDPASNTWAAKPVMPTARENPSTGVIGGRLYALGGMGGTGLLNTNEEYDPGVASSFTALTPNTQYFFKAKARNAIGAETGEITVSTYTLAAIPGTTTPAFTGVSSIAVTVNWAQGANPNGTMYYAQLSTASDFSAISSSSTTSNQQLITSNLFPNTTYYARVAAINGNGIITDYKTLGSTMTWVETPTNIYFDEVSSTAITAAAYAANPAFTGLEVGLSGVAVAMNNAYKPWRNGNTWAVKTPMSSARKQLSGSVISGKLYVVGGQSSGGQVNTNEEYDPVANTWAIKAAMPTARNLLAVGVIGRKLYAVGGVGGTNTNEEYDPVSDSWATKAVMPTARNTLSVGVISGKLYAVGGVSDGNTTLNSNEEYDPAVDIWATKTPMPIARKDVAAGVVGGKLYVVGGDDGSGSVAINEEYDPAADSWAAKAPMPTARQRLSAGVTIGGKLYALGGYNGTWLNTNEQYDPISDTWTTKAAMPTARYNFSAGAINGKLYAVGGYAGSPLAANEEYDPGVASTFTALTPNTLYQFKAKARNALGAETTEVIGFSTYTLAAVPDTTTSLYTTVSSNAVTVNWTQSANPTGVTLYRVQASTDSAFGLVAASSDTYNLNAVLPGLSPNTTYYGRVAAINKNGIITYYKTLGSTMTWVETPANIYFDEVSSNSITASGYAGTPAFTGLETGLSGVAVAMSGVYKPWRNGNTWVTKMAMPAARSGPAGAAVGGKIYVVGGHEYGSATNDNQEYDPVANTWLSKAPMPVSRNYLAAAAVGGKVYAIGGRAGDYGADYNLNEEYDPVANTWATKAPLTTARSWLPAAVAGGKIYVIGGVNGSTNLNTNEEYDPGADTWITRSPMPTSRGGARAAAVSGKVYVVGGNTSSPVNINEEYNPVTNTWSTRAPMSASRSNLAVCAVGEKVYAIGGVGGLGTENEEYDPAVNTWTSKAAMPTARDRAAGTVVGGKIYVSGGDNGSTLGINEEYDPGVASSFTALSPNTQYFFKAKARNAIGAETTEVIGFSTYTLAAVALPQSGPLFMNISSGSIIVNWSSGTEAGGFNGLGASYKIQVSSVSDFSVVTSSSLVSSSQYSVSSLSSNTTYYFRAQAYNSAGMTDYSWLTLGSTITQAIVPGPADPAFTDVYTDSLTVHWDANGNATGIPYFVQVSSTVDFSDIAFSSTTYNSQLITYNLFPNTTYYTHVAAVNAGGRLTDYFAVPGSTPTLSQQVTGAQVTSVYFTSATVNWTALPLTPSSATCEGYIVEASTASNFSGVVYSSFSLQPSAFSLSVPALFPDTTYFFRAGSLNWAGTVNFAAALSSSTYSVQPGSSTENFANIAATSITVKWLSNSNGPGTKYFVEGSTDEFASVAVSSLTPALYPGPFALPFNGLRSNTAYAFRVGALGNNMDLSEPLILGSTVTPPVPPALANYTLWLSSAQVGWQNNGNSDGSKYLCELSTNNFTTVSLSSETVTLSAVFESGLPPNTTCYMRLQTLANGEQAGSGYAYSSSITLAAVPPQVGARNAGPNNAGIWWGSGGNPPGYAISGWLAASNMPAARYGQAAAVSGDRIFISGGTDGTNYRAEVWSAQVSADGAVSQWTQTTSLPESRYGHTMSALKGRLYVTGGLHGGVPQSTVWSAIVSSYGTVGQWEQAPPLPQARYGHASATGENIIYVSGGYNGGARKETWYAKVSDDGVLGGWTEVALLPEARYFHSMALTGSGWIYVSGGNNGTSAKPDVWRAQLNSDGSIGGWTGDSALPKALYGHAMIEAEGAIFMSGGTDGSNAQDGVWRSFINAGGSLAGWAALTSMPSRQFHSMAGVGGKLLILGGFDGTITKSDVWRAAVAGTEYLAERAQDAGFSSGVSGAGWLSAAGYDFGGLVPNTAYHFRVKARNFYGVETEYSPVFSTVTFAVQPSTAQFTGVGMWSLQANWGTRDNPAGTRYEARISSDAAHTQNAASSDTANSFAVFDSLSDKFVYYASVRAYNSIGAYTGWTDLSSTSTKANPALDFSSPTITVNQTGDKIWRNSNSGVYKVAFADTGGALLKQAEVKITTGMAQTGTLISDWVPVLTDINSFDYSDPWPIPSGLWTLLPGGTSYVSVRAFDNNNNSTSTVDAFYILKDTVPPSIINNASGETTWRKDDGGAIYDVDFFDYGSGLQTIQYSASTHPGTADANALDWTTIAQLPAGATVYADNWAVAFAALANAATNYISVRAADAAGSTVTLSGIDVFKILKFVGGPIAGITVPGSAYYSSLAVISGTADDTLSHPLAGTELSIKDSSAGLYWNGTAFLAPGSQWFAAAGNAAWNYAEAIPWTEGVSYWVIARSSDTEGNYSADYSTAVFTFDGYPPSAGILSPADGSTINSLNAVSGTSSDAVSGVKSAEIRLKRLSDDKWWNFKSGNWTVSPSSTSVSGTTSWTYAVNKTLKSTLAANVSYYVTVDAADNAVPANILSFGAAGSTFTFIDNTPPAAVTDLTASTGPLPGTIIASWSFTGDDASSGTLLTGQYKIQYALDPQVSFSTLAAQITVSTANVSAGSRGSSELTGLTPALVYYLRLWTADDAGNWSELSNGTSAQARPYPESRIDGHVLTVSSVGITGVLVEAFDTAEILRASDYTSSDGLGSYSLTGIVVGSYTVHATWSANDIISDISKDGIPSATADVDFMLSVTFELASISGNIEGYNKAEGLRLKAKGVSKTEGAGVYVELYQGGRKISTADVDAAGKFKINNLLPGKYTVKIIGLAEGAKEFNVQLKEGQNLEISPLGTLLKKDKVYAFPNPASKSVIFHLESDISSLKKQIMVFGIDGRVIKEFSDSDAGWNLLSGGKYEFTWNIDSKVASGIYIYEVKVKNTGTGDTASTIKKLAIIK
ncbi:MAG: fibronectin type III domain-containing protein [Elusimicrobia bacterium]|nr:fibronectin type III domain-containing protein [Elusimicrobiota bacterium]